MEKEQSLAKLPDLSQIFVVHIKTSKTWQTLVSKQQVYTANSWYPNKNTVHSIQPDILRKLLV